MAERVTIRQGGKVRRHLYIGPDEKDEIAVTVGPVEDAAAWAAFLADAGNAWIAAGHKPPGREMAGA